MSKELDELDKILAHRGKKAQKMAIQWAKVTAVDWPEKTCEAVGIDDGLAFHDILLGSGSIYLRPTVGSLILVGIIANDETTPVLISAEKVEEIAMKVGNCTMNIHEGFLFKKNTETLAKLMSDLLKEIQKMKFTTNTGSTIKLINTPQFAAIENRFKQFLKDN